MYLNTTRYIMKHITRRTPVLLMLLFVCAGIQIHAAESTAVHINPQPDAARTALAVKRFSGALQFKTVSSLGQDTVSDAAFLSFHNYLAASFPLVHHTMTRKVISGKSLLYTWQGKNTALKPVIFCAHLDVVPADSQTLAQWTHPPFSGTVAEGYIWGRGARDFKPGLMGILESAEYLISQGFVPERTVLFAFGQDEEVQGYNGAAKIAAHLKEQKIEAEMILDEGGGVNQGMMAGVDKSRYVAMIMIAEKGYLSLELSVESDGGHSASPNKKNPLIIISKAIRTLEENQFPASLPVPVKYMFEAVAPQMKYPEKFVFNNLWLTGTMVKRIMLAHPDSAAMLKNTMAFTMFSGGFKDNVIPNRASAVVNIRLMPGTTSAQAIDYVTKTINDSRIKISVYGPVSEPAPVSGIETAGYRILKKTISETFSGALVCPGIVTGTTDIRHYAAISPNLYRLHRRFQQKRFLETVINRTNGFP